MEREVAAPGKVEYAETEEDEEDHAEEDEEECLDEETDGSRTAYKKNRWRVVAVWTNTTKNEAYMQEISILQVIRHIHRGNQRIGR